jgi:anti-sigma B factor antagonist
VVNVKLCAPRSDGQVVVALSGELDVADAVRVAATLTALAANGREIIVDLANLEFMDSSGLAALVRARRDARNVGLDVRLAAPRPQVRRILTITRLIDVFTILAGVDEGAADPGLLSAT